MTILLLFLLVAPLAQSLKSEHQLRPYRINIDKKFVEETRVKASQFRPSLDIDAPKWFDGPPSADVSKVAQYWANDFDFQCFQNEINMNFTHYMTTVPAPGGSYNSSLEIHFIRKCSVSRLSQLWISFEIVLQAHSLDLDF